MTEEQSEKTTEEEKESSSSAESESSSATEKEESPSTSEATDEPKELAKEEVIPAPAPIAPGVPRLERPTGAATVPPDLSPGYGFLAVISLASLVADLATKVWAKEKLEQFPGYIQVFEKKWQSGTLGMAFILAHNKGGAWGLLQGTNENVRKPFFLLVSAAAIAFIVTLFRRLQPNQTALKWGLPLVLGGALGNVFDRIRYGSVIDFIDVHYNDHHWPTFNVADIAICVGVGLMAVDMFTSKRKVAPQVRRKKEEPAATATPAEGDSATPAETTSESDASTASTTDTHVEKEAEAKPAESTTD